MQDYLRRLTPGVRVRSADGVIGTIERLEYAVRGPAGTSAPPGERAHERLPQEMIVRSEDGRWSYRLPTLLVREVTPATASAQRMSAPEVLVALPLDQLPYYRIEPATGAATDTTARPGMAVNQGSQDTLRIPIAEEHLVARKSPVVQGYVRIHKEVGTQQEHFNIPVYHEEAVIERIPADQYDGQEPADNELLIPVTEERLVVRKEVVVREYLRVRKDLVSKQYEVKGDLRRESLDVTTEVPPGSAPQPLLHLPEDEGAATQPATS